MPRDIPGDATHPPSRHYLRGRTVFGRDEVADRTFLRNDLAALPQFATTFTRLSIAYRKTGGHEWWQALPGKYPEREATEQGDPEASWASRTLPRADAISTLFGTLPIERTVETWMGWPAGSIARVEAIYAAPGAQ